MHNFFYFAYGSNRILDKWKKGVVKIILNLLIEHI